jgi:hypothetical protein
MNAPIFKSKISEMGRYRLIQPTTERQELKAIFPRRYVTVPKVKDVMVAPPYYIGTKLNVVGEDGDYLYSAKVAKRAPNHWWLHAPPEISEQLYAGTSVLVYLAEDDT